MTNGKSGGDRRRERHGCAEKAVGLARAEEAVDGIGERKDCFTAIVLALIVVVAGEIAETVPVLFHPSDLETGMENLGFSRLRVDQYESTVGGESQPAVEKRCDLRCGKGYAVAAVTGIDLF